MHCEILTNGYLLFFPSRMFQIYTIQLNFYIVYYRWVSNTLFLNFTSSGHMLSHTKRNFIQTNSNICSQISKCYAHTHKNSHIHLFSGRSLMKKMLSNTVYLSENADSSLRSYQLIRT